MQKQKKKKSPNRGKEVDRILKDNLERGMIAKEDVFFAKKFLNILYEADLPSIGDDAVAAPTDFTPDRNQADFEGALEPETDPNSFDVQGTEPGKSAEDFSNIYVKKCVDWVKKINEFSEWMANNENVFNYSLFHMVDGSSKLEILMKSFRFFEKYRIWFSLWIQIRQPLFFQKSGKI